VTDGEDAAMNTVQPTAPHTSVNRAPGHARGEELRRRHDPVLPLGDPRHRLIRGCGEKFIPRMDFSPHPTNRAAGAAPCPSSMTVFPRLRREGAANRA
jgi:hypothetical protein